MSMKEKEIDNEKQGKGAQQQAMSTKYTNNNEVGIELSGRLRH